MNLSENLKKIRKDNNLSQEQLAEKLGVSRQSVSKWESGLAYPEMDKMLQLCQIFNLNIDELLNQDVNEVSNNKQYKNNINKFIDSFLEYVTKTIDMFSSMKFKEKLKCVFEQIIIALIIISAIAILGLILSNIVSSLISFLPDKLYYPIYQIFKSIYLAFGLVLGVILQLHIFKTRYLDYCVIVNDGVKEESLEEKEIVLEKNSEKIIIRDPKHSGYKFISGLFLGLLVFLKVIVGCLGVCFCFSLISLVIILVLSFSFVNTGLFFIGLLLFIVSGIIINLLVLIIIFKFIISQKVKMNRLAIVFTIFLIIVGLGLGIMIKGLSEFELISDFDSGYYVTLEKEFKMEDNLFFHSYFTNVDYIETDDEDIKIIYSSSKLQQFEFVRVEDGYYIMSDISDFYEFDFIKEIIKDFNNKKIVDYQKSNISIYTSKENIKKLKENFYKEMMD